MIKLLLNPSLKIGVNEEAVVLISEMDCIELPASALPLLTQLQSPTEIDDIAPDDAAHLGELGKLGLLVNANLYGLPVEVASYWLAKKYNLKFVVAQLRMSIQFIGPQADKYRALFAARYPECDVAAENGRLAVYVGNDLLDCDIPADIRSPVLLIKVGGMKQSIGPVLSPNFTYADLRERIGRPFETDLSVPISETVQSTADNILLSELYHLRVQAGLHSASNHVVEWDMSIMTKRFWKVKS